MSHTLGTEKPEIWLALKVDYCKKFFEKLHYILLDNDTMIDYTVPENCNATFETNFVVYCLKMQLNSSNS